MSDPQSMGLPLDFHEWTPVAQAVTLGLMTFFQEDVPTVGAAVLSTAGSLTWQVGLLGCFLGIWMGDAVLYGVARSMGPALLRRRWVRRFADPVAVSRCELWFGEKGLWLLLASRFVPGTRLATYLAAGFLRVPFGKFLLVTGVAVAIWTGAIFALAQVIGPDLIEWLRPLSVGGWALLVIVGVGVLLIRSSGWRFQRRCWQRLSGFVGRWTRWEFWPAWIFYAPVAINYLRLAVRHGGFTVPTAANPGTFSGGFVGESKMELLSQLGATSPECTAEAFLLPSANPEERMRSLEGWCSHRSCNYPLILKPDVGQRGVGVKLIRTPEEAAGYFRQTRAPLLVQRYAAGPREAGIFYYRFPDEPAGHIFAVTEKVFPVLTGDGMHTIEELIWRDARARCIAARYLQRFGDRGNEVLEMGQVLKLVEAGNHAQGCVFRDGSRLLSAELEQRMDDISQKLSGFFIGRYDLRFASEDDLRAGRDFQIIELNGASSEATNIYDPRNSLWTAYRTLFRQWDLVFAIGAANRSRGVEPTGLAFLWRKWRETNALIDTYPVAD